MITYFKIFLVSFILALVLTPLVRHLALRFKIFDHPASRKIHSKPIPKLGGLAIYLSFIIATILNLDFNRNLIGVVIGGTLIFLVGIIDDIRHLRAGIKLLGQLLASFIVIYSGVFIEVIPNKFLALFFTVFGLVGITNALNFLDNMDGLAAGIVAIASFSIFLFASNTGQKWVCFLALALTGSSLGFLRYNFKPAKIFMGDTGSTFLGFTLAAIAVMTQWSYCTPVAITIPVFILGVMIFDTSLITILRIKDGKVKNFRQWIEHVDTDHFSHRLVRFGMGQRRAVLFIYLCALILGLTANILPKENVRVAYLADAVLFIVALIGIIVLDRAGKKVQ
jgi:UDP-GlcNAc:undecaprenyl-phosphate GlcNAc-1-phosphate transferase